MVALTDTVDRFEALLGIRRGRPLRTRPSRSRTTPFVPSLRIPDPDPAFDTAAVADELKTVGSRSKRAKDLAYDLARQLVAELYPATLTDMENTAVSLAKFPERLDLSVIEADDPVMLLLHSARALPKAVCDADDPEAAAREAVQTVIDARLVLNWSLGLDDAHLAALVGDESASRLEALAEHAAAMRGHVGDIRPLQMSTHNWQRYLDRHRAGDELSVNILFKDALRLARARNTRLGKRRR